MEAEKKEKQRKRMREEKEEDKKDLDEEDPFDKIRATAKENFSPKSPQLSVHSHSGRRSDYQNLVSTTLSLSSSRPEFDIWIRCHGFTCLEE